MRDRTKKRAIVWGAGGKGRDFLREKIRSYAYEIVCFTDGNEKNWDGLMLGEYPIINPLNINDFEYDLIIICSQYIDEIMSRLISECRVPNEKVITYKDIEERICKKLVEKYQGQEKDDLEETLKFYKQGILNYYGAYNAPIEKFSRVYRDDMGWPFIIFEEKKMFFPRDYIFDIREGEEVVPDILYEQAENSPHRYLTDGCTIHNGDVIMDAGVCEGNFALRYIEKVSKAYLIEADNKWMKALEKSFAPFKDKVVFCNKYLSGRDNKEEATIDALVQDGLDFIKMDIEGSEIYALLGGKHVLQNNDVQCAICAYHRQYDEKYISYILESYGYSVSHSKGFVFFLADEYLMDSMDLRRGVIYAKKE